MGKVLSKKLLLLWWWLLWWELHCLSYVYCERKNTKGKMEKIGNLVCSFKDPWLNDSLSFRSVAKGIIILKWHIGGRTYLPRDRHEAESNMILLTSSLLFPLYFIFISFLILTMPRLSDDSFHVQVGLPIQLVISKTIRATRRGMY